MIYYQVYNTVNLINGKNYIGVHKINSLRPDNYLGSGKYLNYAIKKYGKDNFIKYELEICETEEEAFNYEKYIYIPFYRRGRKAEYNIADGGQGGAGAKGKHWKLSEETRKNMSIVATGRKRSEESKIKQSNSTKGIKKPEHSKKIKGENNPMYGKKHTESAKKAISEKNTGKKRTDEVKQRLKLAKQKSIKTGTFYSPFKDMKSHKWFNNGIKNIKAKECPEGFISGRVK